MTYAAPVSKKHGSKKHHGGAPKNTAGRKPKKKCCVSKPRCTRCPLRMLAEGTLPDGYTVKKRRLVTLDGGKKAHESKGKNTSKGKHKDKRKDKGKGKGKGKQAA